MVTRQIWQKKIEAAWQRRSIVWLSGVRRVGKTSLAQSLPNCLYFDCELPRTRQLMSDPEDFLQAHRGKRLVLDEIHRLENPSELLKIAADHYPDIKILATGSSTLAASGKFRDTLTGRKEEIWLTPVLAQELELFGVKNISTRLSHGGLPPLLLNAADDYFFQEWMDSYWSKDIQELFRLERRSSFQRFLELLMIQSGGIFESNKLAVPCEVSRTTIMNYLNVLEATKTAHVIRPHSTSHANEIKSAPKVYAFDTGFVCYHKGWKELRTEDKGLLWEHLILNELHAKITPAEIKYWRDKSGHEIDFILTRRGKPPIAIECKWSEKNFETRNLAIFRKKYPGGENWLISQDVDKKHTRSLQGIKVEFLNLTEFAKRLD